MTPTVPTGVPLKGPASVSRHATLDTRLSTQAKHVSVSTIETIVPNIRNITCEMIYLLFYDSVNTI